MSGCGVGVAGSGDAIRPESLMFVAILCHSRILVAVQDTTPGPSPSSEIEPIGRLVWPARNPGDAAAGRASPREGVENRLGRATGMGRENGSGGGRGPWVERRGAPCQSPSAHAGFRCVGVALVRNPFASRPYASHRHLAAEFRIKTILMRNPVSGWVFS